MSFKRLKAAVAGGFLLVSGVLYFTGVDNALAQRRPKPEKRKNVLATVAGYKSWKLVSKPSPESSTDTFKIFGSSLGG